MELLDEIAKIRSRAVALGHQLPQGLAALDFVLPGGSQSIMDPHMQLVQLLMDKEVRAHTMITTTPQGS